MKGLIPILDAGHGGMIAGQYQTAGKRSPNWEKGIIYEGMANRWVVNRTIELLDNAKIPYLHASPEFTDIPLWQRVQRSNDWHREQPNQVYLVSSHFNAGGGKGGEIFTSKGETKSDPIATIFYKHMVDGLDDHVMRNDYSDGDPDKEASFKVLVDTNCPAVLIEWAFMDNKNDYNRIWDKSFIEQCAQVQFCAIEELYR
ncbi:N-acetylmuramoyl-L-alanine amidase [Nonlabens tegetincola]|uniref:N-acetylmuramoyl-L-alanine amidase n=1 Tax=Nonlabens tegetincola TaxID=323273 RepID=A0A090Q1B6_9FLAO|nr:N-acetylmuramoyl-L-alanine amidase [Nonlabens tegetincola]GAK96830.1 N-acetylmuramoyl-L-alanine amidase [Nonlabens tegetincola]